MEETVQITTLQSEHANLERRLADAHESPHPDPKLIADLKKQKLRLKDQIAELNLH